MALKAKLEAIIYAAEEPITLEQIALLVKDMVLAEEAAAKERAAAEASVEAGAPLDAVEQTEFVAEQPMTSVDENSPEIPHASDTGLQGPPEAAEGEAPGEVGDATVREAQGEAPADVPVGEADAAVAESASVSGPEPTRGKKRKSEAAKKELSDDARVRAYLRPILEELIADYQKEERGIEIRQIAGGYKMATKPEHHDVVRAFAKSLKPPVRLSLAALETLAVIAYKQPVTVPEISEIRGVEAGGVIGTLLDRKLITTAGRKQVIGRPILYKTTKDFLMRFGLNDVSELPSMEEFEKLASDGQVELFGPDSPEGAAEAAQNTSGETQAEAESSAAVEEPENSTAGNS